MYRPLLITLCLCAAVAHADTPKPAVFPVVVGTKFTFTSAAYESTWTTKLAATGTLMQFAPHEDTLNYFTKAGFRIAKDGIYIVGETLADLGEPAPAPARAIGFPVKKGATAKVPGFLPTTYTVGARETVKVPAGRYSAWKITISDKVNPSGAVWIAPGVGIVKIRLPSGRVDELAKIEPPTP
jgi:hypothetical protein